MKKLGLAGLLVAGVITAAGCTNSQIEQGYVQVAGRGYDFDCKEARVTMTPKSYIIMCNLDHYFSYSASSNRDMLVWGKIHYFDNDSSGDLDEIVVDSVTYSKQEIKPEQNHRYKERISNLNKDLVHEIWESRWK